MSATNTAWFHCGRCGSLFSTEIEKDDQHLCPACGCRTSLGKTSRSEQTADSIPGASGTVTSATKSLKNIQTAWFKKTNGRHLIIKVLAAWLAVLAVSTYGIVWICSDGTNNPPPENHPVSTKDLDSEENTAFLNQAAPLCRQTFSNFLSAETSGISSQLVLRPGTTSALMARFYSMNRLEVVDPKMLTLNNVTVVKLAAGKAIESYWKSSDGRQFDVLFQEEDGEWRLDWEHYVKFSDCPWPLFLAGNGEARGQFRLLARERLSDEHKNSPSISILLREPRFGYPSELGYQSPEFLISRSSKNGSLLTAAFALANSGKRAFNAQLPNIYPEGFIPIRVKIHRFEENTERRFELEEIIACHWYSVDNMGVEISNSLGTFMSTNQDVNDQSLPR